MGLRIILLFAAITWTATIAFGQQPDETAPLPTFKQQIEQDWTGRDQPTSGSVEKHLHRGAMILADLRGRGVDVSAHEEALNKAAKQRDALLAEKNTDSAAWKTVYLQTRWAVRRVLFEDPLVKSEDLLLVRRHHAHAGHQCSRRRARYNRHGGEICLLKGIEADAQGKLVSLTEGKFPQGVFGRPDLSFDGGRIVFGFAATDVKDMVEEPYVVRGQNPIGNGSFYQLWEMELSGDTPPRQITRGKSRREESTDPIYLPDGRIAFMSPRAGGMVMCGDWAWADCMFTINPDGSDARQITWAKEGEWDPCLMDDGSIMFTRWEYVMRFWKPTQLIWNVRPDGTNPRVIGGYLIEERNYARCRQIPGTSKVVCVEAHHHNDGSGNILVVDLRHGRDKSEGHERIVSGAADCPYPLSEDYFLISYDPQGTGRGDRRRVAKTTGVYLADTHGGLELIYRDAELSAMYPTPVRPRKRPSPVPPVESGIDGNFGEFVIQDVHEGLPPSMHGKARYVQVVQVHERHIHTSPCNLWVGMGGFETKTVLGTAPVEADGSAYFRVPSGTSVFFSVLDENHQALHTMRMTTDLKPGERAGCIGCHEPMTATPGVGGMPLALQRPASELTPPPWGLSTVGFPKLIQPILDKHCVSCHDGTEGKDKSFDLRAGAEKPELFEENVWVTYAEGYKKFYKYQSYWALLPYAKHADINQYHTPPGSWGSRVSPLAKTLAKGHYDVTLDDSQWRAICAWLDCNVPYLDDYRKFAVDPEIRAAAR